MSRWILVVAAFGWMTASSAHADTMRCGRFVVSTGMSPYEVVSKCGDPVYQQVVRELVTVIVNRQSHITASGAHITRQTAGVDVTTLEQAPIYRDIDRWTYNFGSHSLLREVDFYNGEVIAIRSAGRAP